MSIKTSIVILSSFIYDVHFKTLSISYHSFIFQILLHFKNLSPFYHFLLILILISFNFILFFSFNFVLSHIPLFENTLYTYIFIFLFYFIFLKAVGYGIQPQSISFFCLLHNYIIYLNHFGGQIALYKFWKNKNYNIIK